MPLILLAPLMPLVPLGEGDRHLLMIVGFAPLCEAESQYHYPVPLRYRTLLLFSMSGKQGELCELKFLLGCLLVISKKPFNNGFQPTQISLFSFLLNRKGTPTS
jgi:hypothetical protein